MFPFVCHTSSTQVCLNEELDVSILAAECAFELFVFLSKLVS